MKQKRDGKDIKRNGFSLLPVLFIYFKLCNLLISFSAYHCKQVDVTVLPATENAGGLGELAQSLILPAALFAGLFFLSRRSGPQMPGGMGGGNPMQFGKAKAEIQMIPDTGVNFDDVAGCDGAKLELAEVVDLIIIIITI